MELYAPLIPETWGTLELLLNTEETIHTVVRATNPDARPPRLQFTQTGPCGLRFVYDSPHRLDALAKGIIQGVANHYGDRVEVRENRRAGGAVEMDIQILPREGADWPLAARLRAGGD
jgi:heme-NO-binding protein